MSDLEHPERDSSTARAMDAQLATARAMDAHLHDVPLEVTIELGRVTMSLREVAAKLTPGAILSLGKPEHTPLEVRVQSRLIARAEPVVIGDRCGVRILELVDSDREEACE